MESIAPLFAAEASRWSTALQLIIVCAVLVGPFILGTLIANWLRMRDYGWRIGLILCAIASSCLILWNIWNPEKKQFDFKLGVDLQGGVILIYEVEQSVNFTDDLTAKGRQAAANAQAAGEADFSMSALIEALSRRINPAGTKEIVIRPYGERQVEIIIPEVDQREVEQIKKVISTAGVLQFRIVANSRDHQDIIELAREAAQDPVKRRAREIYDDSGTQVGLWARVGRETHTVGGVRPFKVAVGDYTVRDAQTGEILEIPANVSNNPADRSDEDRRLRLARYAADQGIKEMDVLMATNDGLNVNGGHLGGVMKSVDELMKPCIHFSLKGVGVNLFGELTGRNSPEGNFHRQLGIVLDNELLSAPNIQERITDRGRITGQFTDEEVQFLVNILQAGSLPVVLNKIPISSSLISPLLGQETIDQGKSAMILGTILVFVFMLFYYRYAGFLACIVLLLNILFTLALIVLIKAPLTLPGLAGLVLTVGMAVDSNVLIYERMREESSRGAAMRMVIRNGFNRATTTIIDSNLTTVLTALILYAIGTDQLRGFAVTLTLGIITSMFTAIFCSRVLFDISERTQVLKQLKMFQFIKTTNIDFIGYRHAAVVLSAILLGGGLIAVIARGSDLLDIDFTGGSSVHVMLEERAETDTVRDLLDPKFAELNVPYSLTGMSMTPGETKNDMFKIDAKIAEVEELEKIIQSAFKESGGQLKLATYALNYTGLRETTISVPTSRSAEMGTQPAAQSTEPTKKAESGADTKSESTKTDAAPKKEAEPKVEDAPKADSPKTDAPKSDAPKTDEPKADAPKTDEPKADAPKTDEPKADAPKSDSPKADDAAKSEEAPKSDSDKKDDAPESPSTPEKKDADQPSEKDEARTSLPPDNVLALAFAQDEKSEEKNSDADVKSATDEKSAADEKTEADKDAAKKETPSESASKDSAKENADADTQPANNQKDAEAEAKATPAVEAASSPAAASDATKKTDDAFPAASAQPAARTTTVTQAEAKLNFENGINASTLRGEIDQTAQELNIPLSYFDVDNPEWDRVGSNAYREWTVRLSTSTENAKKILDHLTEKFENQPVWPSSNKIGPTVAGRLQRTAIIALIASWIGIIIYVWIRFQNLVFGLAAVVALVHDVLFTVAALAASHWLAGMFGFLLIEDFKIGLTIVAALLTIIGYSINDTIVIFDRVREIRGKSPDITADMINLSLNQTLSRTILTFFTTFIVVVVLYIFGGQGIHGFAFAMVVGMLTGTYSTVFIATPFVLWLSGTPIAKKQAE